MELRHLRYFEAVARLSHVTRAAAELHIAQPALSKQISQLEHELGVSLFDRVGRNVRLTESGEALLPHARAVLAQVEAARAEMAERVGLRRGRVSLGTTPTVGTKLLPKALAQFNQRYPGIELRLRESGVQTLLELLDTGMVDIAVVTLPVDDPDLTMVPILTEELVVAVWKNHRLADKGHVALADLQQEAWVMSPENYELRDATMEACQQAGFTPRVVLDGGEMDTLLRVVEAGVGIALMPQLAMQDVAGLVALHVSDQQLTRSLGLVWCGQRVASPAARACREFLVEQLHNEQTV
ncbi:MAG: LysR family transcriptional regulator [Chloroflexaceae bacterium]|jgi:DNA-binding transcriptional LysR family regulator|nr:LysR family transcriptional regulator [Chloroflexaceae bacterium]